MKTIKDNYGKGMMEFEYHSKKAFGQIGGIDGFESVVLYFPADSLAFAFCTNGRVGSTKEVVLKLLNIYFERKYQNPHFRLIDTKTKPQGLLKYSGVYSNKSTSLKIIISEHHQKLLAQVVGGAVYVLEPVAINKFKCDSPNVVIEFNHEKDEFTIYEGTVSYDFIKEN
jgi:D-alanyl-D-alanine carboxypeptidase